MKYYCKTCGQTMDEHQFYKSNNPDQFAENDNFFPECKKCLTRHVNNFEPRTYLWILQDADVPYIEEQWIKLLQTYGKDPTKLTGTTILGRYLSKMKLAQYRKLRWSDTESLKRESDEAKRETMARQGYTESEISGAIREGLAIEQLAAERPPEIDLVRRINVPDDAPLDQPMITADPAPIATIDASEYFKNDLTEEDIKYLTIKWGHYKPHEWIQLEEYYQNMVNAYDIQTPSHIDYLKLICKTSLKCHQLLNLGDVDSFQKMSRTYDMLMKSAKFTAAQDKNENGEYVSAIDELVLIAEKEGFIPRYYIDQPNDYPDKVLADMRRYTDTLVRDELNLGNLIENAVRTMQREESKQEDEEEEDIETLSDADFAEHMDFIEKEKLLDEAMEEDVFNGIE